MISAVRRNRRGAARRLRRLGDARAGSGDLESDYAQAFVDERPAAAEQAALGLAALAEMRERTSGDFAWLELNESTLRYLLGRALLNEFSWKRAETARHRSRAEL